MDQVATVACGAGSPDLYGLGVRVGAYLLWFSAQLAYFFKLDGAVDRSETWTVFSLALSIAIYILTFQQQDAAARAFPTDIVVMLYMIFGGMFGSKGFVSRPSRLRPVWWHLLLEGITLLVAAGYASWFWFGGAGSQSFQQGEGCEPVVFLFTRIPQQAFRSVSVFFAILAVVVAAGWLYTLVKYCVEGLPALKNKLWPLDPKSKRELIDYLNLECHDALVDFLVDDYGISATSSARLEDISSTHLIIRAGPGQPRRIIQLDRPLPDLRDKGKVQRRFEGIAKIRRILTRDMKVESGYSLKEMVWFCKEMTEDTMVRLRDSQSKTLATALALIPVAYAAYAVVGIELMLTWNGINDVYTITSTGQLIPFVIGVVGFFKTLHDIHFELKVSL